MNKWKIILLAATVSGFALSYIIHYPGQEWSIYSDLVSFWYRPMVSELKIPYVEETFEYPPLAGFITYFSALIGDNLPTYYTAFSAIIFAFYLIQVFASYSIVRARGGSGLYVLLFLVLTPSTPLYLVYNFDGIFAALVLLSLMLLERRKLRSSALIFSAAALVKLVNLLLLPLMMEVIGDWRRRLYYLAYALTPILAVNLILYLINPENLLETYLYHTRWGLENAWFIYLFPSQGSWDTAKIFSAFLMAYGLVKVCLSRVGDLYERAFMVFSVFLLTNYVFTPQMVLWLLPLLAVIGRLPLLFYPFDAANAGIILTWFMVDNPIEPGSLPQNLALFRAAALFYILIEVYVNARKRGEGA